MTCAPIGSMELVSRSLQKLRKVWTSGPAPSAPRLAAEWKKKNCTVCAVSHTMRDSKLCFCLWKANYCLGVINVSICIILVPFSRHNPLHNLLGNEILNKNLIVYFCRFYIGCDKCQDWFHGACVGITAAEADNIEFYTCPRCTESQAQASKQPLTSKDYDSLKRLLRSLQVRWSRKCAK